MIISQARAAVVARHPQLDRSRAASQGSHQHPLDAASVLNARGIMAADKTKKTQDNTRINIQEPYELGYWSRKFGVSVHRLSDAVQKVGTHAEDVAIELGKEWK